MSKDEIQQKLRKALSKSPSLPKIRKVSLFGSYLHGNQKMNSDIDLLIEIVGQMGLFEFVGLKQYLEKQMGINIDLVEKESLSKYFRDEVISEAAPLYET